MAKPSHGHDGYQRNRTTYRERDMALPLNPGKGGREINAGKKKTRTLVIFCLPYSYVNVVLLPTGTAYKHVHTDEAANTIS